jgi:predicted CoA-substrate-specific enzyme activase
MGEARRKKMICAGIDAGSRAIKAVLFESESGDVIGSGVADQGVKQDDLAEKLFGKVLREANVKRRQVSRIVATGYGRNAIKIADTTITEISCQARGVLYGMPDVRTVIDIGGQDSKLMRLNENGAVRDFAMNDRCAAGTGRFLEVVALRLDVPLTDVGRIVKRATNPASISSTCVVFAETEIVGLLASGAKRENILAGVQAAIASRIATMAGRKVESPVVFTGGVALIPGMAKALETALDCKVFIARNPQLTCALGAAILASER